MLGAIVGDIVGSAYEFNPTSNYDFEMFKDGSQFTDDTICTIAIADALLKGRDYGESLHEWCRRYMKPKGGFGGRFRKWVESDHPIPYGSFGNGSAMRVSPVGMWFAGDWDKLYEEAKKSAACTHNHPKGIKGATTIADAIAWAVTECDGLFSDKKLSDMVIEYIVDLMSENDYDPNTDYEDFRGKFDETCQNTVPPVLDIICKSTSFEDAIRKAVSLGADADTLGAIVGSIAEHIWGIPDDLKDKAMSYLTEEMRKVVDEFYLALENKETYKPESKKIRQMESMMFWKLGAGNMGKFFNMENPMPDKTVKATKDSWQTKEIPMDDVADISMKFAVPEPQMKALMQGHIPEAQEDHWFMYCDSNHIRYYRSWTGECAFEAHFHKEGENYVIDHLFANIALNEFGVNGDIPAKALFLYLIKSDIENVNHRCWTGYIQAWEDQFKKNIDSAEERKKQEKEAEEERERAEEARKKAEEEARKKAEAEEYLRKLRADKEARLLHKENERIEATKDARYYMTCVVAGTQFIADQKIFYTFGVNDLLTLNYEKNKFDENAVAIFFKDQKIGYIPRRQNAEIAKLLRIDWHKEFVAYVSDWKGCDEKRRITIKILVKTKKSDPFLSRKDVFDAYKKAEQSHLDSVFNNRCHRITPERISHLEQNEVFVFGSNGSGYHGGGAAHAAMEKFGAVWGQGDGLQGQSYAISTMEGLVATARNINRFVNFAAEHQELRFYVTSIGCGKAGYAPVQIAPLFRIAVTLPNVFLPKSFWEYFWQTEAEIIKP